MCAIVERFLTLGKAARAQILHGHRAKPFHQSRRNGIKEGHQVRPGGLWAMGFRRTWCHRSTNVKDGNT